MSDQDDLSEEDRLVEFLYDKMIDSISTDVACGMHRMVKTGAIPYSDLVNPRSRRDIYSSIHESDQHMQDSLEKYATEVPPPSKRQRRTSLDEVTESQQHSNTIPENQVTLEGDEKSQTMTTRGHAMAAHDIWGRIPPKEPKATSACPVCSRQVSTLRFAPHLDKCMGIGTMSRAAAQNHSIIS